MADQSNPTSTTFAGDSNPQSAKNMAWGSFLIAAVLAPIAVLTAIVVYVLFSMVRISHKVIAAFVFIYGLALVVTGQITQSISLYIASFLDILKALGTDANMANVIIGALLMQAPLSLLVGGIIGVGYSTWRYIRRPVWVDTKFRLTPVQIMRKLKNTYDIRNDKNSPANGRTLGIGDTGDRIIQTDEESEAHTLLIGGAGTGKTTTLLIGARDIIRRGESLVFVDMKGSDDVPVVLAEYAERYNRPFYHWTSQNPMTEYTGPSKNGPAYYDGIGKGDPTRKADLILSGREWSEDFYKLIIKGYLQLAFTVAEGAPLEDKMVDSLSEAIQLLDPQVLKKRSLKLVGDPRYNHIVQEINHMTDRKLDTQTKTTLDSMRNQLGILRNSIQGQWLRKDPEGIRDINLKDVADKGAVVVFTIDSGTYEDSAKTLGNLIIQDLKTVSGELMQDRSRYPLNVFVDEFSAIGSDSIATLLARCRSAGIPVTLSTQSLGDLRVVGEAFMDQLTGIVSSFIVHRANSLKDAEVYAGFGGKAKKYVHRESVESRSGKFGGIGTGSGTGQGTLESIEDFIVMPSQIQNLKKGELYFISKSTDRIEHVRVIKEANMQVSNENDNASSEEDRNWKPNEDDHVLSFDKDDLSKYTIDPTINNPVGQTIPDANWNPYAEVKENESNQESLARIFNKENLREDAPVKTIEKDTTDSSLESFRKAKEPTKALPSRRTVNELPLLSMETHKLPSKPRNQVNAPALPERPRNPREPNSARSGVAPALPPLPTRKADGEVTPKPALRPSGERQPFKKSPSSQPVTDNKQDGGYIEEW